MSNPQKLSVQKQVSRKDILFAIARVPKTTRLFVGSSDFGVHDLDIADKTPVSHKYVGHRSYVSGVTLADGALISGAYDGTLIWWDVDSRTRLRTIDAHQKWVRGVNATPDGKTIVSVADDMVCRAWDTKSGKLIHELRGHQPMTPHHFPSMLFCTAISRDGKLLATADKVGHIVIWDLEKGKQLKTLDAPVMYTWDPKQRIHSIGGIRALAFSPDSKLLAAGGIGQIGNIDHLGAKARLEVFDWRAGKRTHEFPGDKFAGIFEHLEFHPDGKWLVGAGGDHSGFIQFFDLAQKKMIKGEKAPMHVHDLTINEEADTIYAAGHGKLVVWELKA